MARYEAAGDFTAAEFVDIDMSRSSFREVDLSGIRMRGVLLFDADIDGAINGLRLNGVDVAPLVEAELDRLHPERLKLRPTTPHGMREAWHVVEQFWGETMIIARSRPESDLHMAVDDEWSFVETLRHLIFVIDSWFGVAIEGRSRPFHPVGLPPSFIRDAERCGVDVASEPSFGEVAKVRAERMAQVRAFVDSVTQPELDRVREPNPEPFWPTPEPRTAIACMRVLLDEEWAHHQFAVRDLTKVMSGSADGHG